jgi:excinuclease ABC subunit C
MEFVFTEVVYDPDAFLEQQLPQIPKVSGVYKIFDTRGELIVLDKSSHLFNRLERFFGPHSEKVKDLDLRSITSRIEFIRTTSPLETVYVLYRERRRLFPRSYRKMKTFRFYTLMKINRRQRFPRIYAAREIKPGVDYYGPFVSRGQFTRLKTTLERTFRLRPCVYNIRGSDPHPDCLYFQMHTCSRPCNDDIDRAGYLADVDAARAFIEGSDEEIAQPLIRQITELAEATQFEAAEALRRKLDKVHRARQETKETFRSVWNFDYLALLPAGSVARCKIAFIRAGAIAKFEEYEVETLAERLPPDLDRVYSGPLDEGQREWQYDEFCLVCNFILDPLQSVDLIEFSRTADFASQVQKRVQERRKKVKGQDDSASSDEN